ncbi:MAG: hypothetical protein CVT98_03555 [Bacteroidetes bacterium HGW-Bacteroidetes-15]|nr:MAG: hypothetical protein CVT98_03555 [Bacteroidetes bacterium HGW-Bacteroidetes-15]
MKKILFVLFLLIAFGGSVFSQFTSKNNYTGAWTNNNSWVGGTAPGTNLSTNVTIYGFITLSGSLTFGGAGGDLIVRDTLVIDGNLTLGNNNNLTIHNGGILIVKGNVIAANKVDIAGNGYFIVFGDFTKDGAAGQGSFTSDDSPSNVFIGGTIDVPGGWADGPGDVFNCDGADDYEGTTCNWGNFDDILEDPINDFIESTCSSKPIITSQPADATVPEGSNATFSLTSSSAGITYRWQIKPNGSADWSNIFNDATYSGATTNSLQVSSVTLAMDGDMFRCVVRFTNGCSTTSNAATLNVTSGCTITLSSDPLTENQELCVNNPIDEITYNTTGATGATFSGLPAGVSGSWSSGVITISGTPTVTGTFNYTVDLDAPCVESESGTITVNELPNVVSIVGNNVSCSSNIDFYEVTEDVDWTYSWSIEDEAGVIQSGANTYQIEVLWKTKEELFTGPTAMDTNIIKKVSCEVTNLNGCSKIVEILVTIYRTPETGPQFHIPNTYGN